MASKLFWRPVFSKMQNNSRLISTGRDSATDCNMVLTEEIGDKGVLILNRPKALNALTVDMMTKMYRTIDRWQSTKSLIILKSNVEKVFCAGGDVAAIVEADKPEYGKSVFRVGYSLEYLIANLQVPYVALLNGITIGGGVGISVNGKYRIATEKTLFAMPEATIGLFPDSSATYFFPRLQGKLGYYLGLTGFRLKGADVLHAGIATHYCESEHIPQIEKCLLSLRNPNDIENVINDFCPKPKSEFTLGKHLEQINKHFSASSIEEILINLETDNSDWAKRTIKTLRRISPTSLKVTHRALDLGANLSLSECFRMEYRLANRLIQSTDFNEGVRSVLISKDNNPKWNPARMEDVTDQQIFSLFQPLPNNEDMPKNLKF